MNFLKKQNHNHIFTPMHFTPKPSQNLVIKINDENINKNYISFFFLENGV